MHRDWARLARYVVPIPGRALRPAGSGPGTDRVDACRATALFLPCVQEIGTSDQMFHQGRDTVLQTGLKIHWSGRSASSSFNRVWNVTKSFAKHHSLLSPSCCPWVMQHQPWPSPSAWTKTRSLHGCRNFYLLILPSLSFSLFSIRNLAAGNPCSTWVLTPVVQGS